MGSCYSVPKQKELDLEEYLDRAQTGDVVLISSHGRDARCVKFFTASPYSHVGMVVRTDTPIEGGKGLYLWHAPSLPCRRLPDLLSESRKMRFKTGPQLNDLRKSLKLYALGSEVVIRRIHFEEQFDPMWKHGRGKDELLQFLREEHTKVYERNTIELLRSAWDGPGGMNTENTEQYFCSELIAETYKKFGVMDTYLPSNEFVPSDFSRDRQPLDVFSIGVSLGRERRLVRRRRRHNSPYST